MPPGYRRQSPPRRPKLDPYRGVVDRILEEDRSLPKKQRHTAKRIYERLRAEHSFTGKYTIVKDYVRERRRRTREMYVPLSHPAGDAQCDFGQAKAVIGGVEQTIHYFVLDLPHRRGAGSSGKASSSTASASRTTTRWRTGATAGGASTGRWSGRGRASRPRPSST